MRRVGARHVLLAGVLAATIGPACGFLSVDGLTGRDAQAPDSMSQGDDSGAVDEAGDEAGGEAGADTAIDAVRSDGPSADGTRPPTDGASRDARDDGGDATGGPVVAHVQNVAQTASGNSLTVTFGNAVGAGDLLIGAFHGMGNVTVSDSLNGAWTHVSSQSNVYLFSLQHTVAAAAGHLAITVKSNAQGPLRICADEFSGLSAASALDQTSTGSATGATWSAGTTPAIPAGELVYAWAGTSEGNLVFTAGTTDGVAMTLGGQSTSNANGTIVTEYALSSAAGAQDSNAMVSPASQKGVNGGQATFLR
jgi:hypothetical protein